MAAPVIKEGLASSSSTRSRICSGEAPMESAASTTPWSTSRTELSTIRAIKGDEAMIKGTSVALEPMVVPMTARVMGMTHTSRMIKGTLRSRFTPMPRIRLNTGQGYRPSLAVAASSSPRGSPIRYARAVEPTVMYRVSQRPLPIRGSISKKPIYLTSSKTTPASLR